MTDYMRHHEAWGNHPNLQTAGLYDASYRTTSPIIGVKEQRNSGARVTGRPKSVPPSLKQYYREHTHSPPAKARPKTAIETSNCDRVFQVEHEPTRKQSLEAHLPTKKNKPPPWQRALDQTPVPVMSSPGYILSKSKDKIRMVIKTDDFFEPLPEENSMSTGNTARLVAIAASNKLIGTQEKPGSASYNTANISHSKLTTCKSDDYLYRYSKVAGFSKQQFLKARETHYSSNTNLSAILSEQGTHVNNSRQHFNDMSDAKIEQRGKLLKSESLKHVSFALTKEEASRLKLECESSSSVKSHANHVPYNSLDIPDVTPPQNTPVASASVSRIEKRNTSDIMQAVAKEYYDGGDSDSESESSDYSQSSEDEEYSGPGNDEIEEASEKRGLALWRKVNMHYKSIVYMMRFMSNRNDSTTSPSELGCATDDEKIAAINSEANQRVVEAGTTTCEQARKATLHFVKPTPLPKINYENENIKKKKVYLESLSNKMVIQERAMKDNTDKKRKNDKNCKWNFTCTGERTFTNLPKAMPTFSNNDKLLHDKAMKQIQPIDSCFYDKFANVKLNQSLSKNETTLSTCSMKNTPRRLTSAKPVRDQTLPYSPTPTHTARRAESRSMKIKNSGDKEDGNDQPSALRTQRSISNLELSTQPLWRPKSTQPISGTTMTRSATNLGFNDNKLAYNVDKRKASLRQNCMNNDKQIRKGSFVFAPIQPKIVNMGAIFGENQIITEDMRSEMVIQNILSMSNSSTSLHAAFYDIDEQRRSYTPMHYYDVSQEQGDGCMLIKNTRLVNRDPLRRASVEVSVAAANNSISDGNTETSKRPKTAPIGVSRNPPQGSVSSDKHTEEINVKFSVKTDETIESKIARFSAKKVEESSLPKITCHTSMRSSKSESSISSLSKKKNIVKPHVKRHKRSKSQTPREKLDIKASTLNVGKKRSLVTKALPISLVPDIVVTKERQASNENVTSELNENVREMTATHFLALPKH